MLQNWNTEANEWHRLTTKYNLSQSKDAISFIKNISAVRSNLIAAVNLGKIPKETMHLFQKNWNLWLNEVKKAGYTMFPTQMGNLKKEVGKIIYCCSPRAQQKKMILVVPGIKKQGKLLLPPVTTVILPANTSFPDHHKAKNLAGYWRGILGELELLTIHVRMQPKANCAIESIDRNKVIPLTAENRAKIIDEIKRRKQVFERSLSSQASNYQIATNYWRIEECFWSLFHDDRPFGHSFFDILRKRVQDWRGFLARKHKIMAKDFVPKKDSLGAINSYVEGIIVQKNQQLSPGKVIRQLRPALIVQEKNSKRTLKGRVIST
ncbi:hypothetical protein [Candidatus Uabimicrobium sp. HlEnr_7]|uniref:hypothetical protein n=1 Tax=Candidatus Uabimicrobium helgolandensis TaxID=3095367 RepID=UPI0035586C23